MNYFVRDWQVDWKRVGDYLLGRSTAPWVSPP